MGKKMICALLVCLLLIQPAFAYVGIETGKDASLTIDYKHAGVTFRIYRVADVSRTVRFTLCGDFVQYADLQEVLDEWDWDTLANNLEARFVRDRILCTASGKTNENGALTFDDLNPGLYLVMGDTYRKGDTTYYLKSSLVSIPNLRPDDTWDYDPVITPKHSSEKDPEPPTSPKTSISVQKIWQDAGYEEERPESIIVQLLKDGTMVDTVTLSAENNWRWTWSKLASGHQYHVVETSVAEGYSDRYSREGNTVVIVNTYLPPQLPEEPDNPQPPKDPEEPDIEDIPDEDVPLDKPTLPETGQLWWPVLLLTAAGLALILVGVIRYKGDSHEA